MTPLNITQQLLVSLGAPPTYTNITLETVYSPFLRLGLVASVPLYPYFHCKAIRTAQM